MSRKFDKIVFALLPLFISQNSYSDSNGLTAIWPVFEGAVPYDAVGVRFKFRVASNTSEVIKIIFSDSRFCGNTADTYLLEYNVYDHGLRYEDPVNTVWPLLGDYIPRESSLRVAVPDYVMTDQVGVKTFSPNSFPRQRYMIDNIEGLWKTDLIYQYSLNNKTCSVEVNRGDVTDEVTGWKADGTWLPFDLYRQWHVEVECGPIVDHMTFVFPDDSAQFLCPSEPLVFFTEFLNGVGDFKVFYWDMGIKRNSMNSWQPIFTWEVSRHDGSINDFGFRLAEYEGNPVVEISNNSATPYLPVGSIIDLTKSCPENAVEICGGINEMLLLGVTSEEVICCRASESITLLPGFFVEKGGVFSARID